MRVLLKAVAWTVAMLGTAAASGFNTSGESKTAPSKEPIPLSRPIDSGNRYFQNIYLAQAETPKKAPTQKEEEKYQFIKNEHIKLATEKLNDPKELDSILLHLIVNHPEFDITKEEKIKINHLLK